MFDSHVCHEVLPAHQSRCATLGPSCIHDIIAGIFLRNHNIKVCGLCALSCPPCWLQKREA